MKKLPKQYTDVANITKKIFKNVSVDIDLQEEKFSVLYTITLQNEKQFNIVLNLKNYTYTIFYGTKKSKCANKTILKRALTTLYSETKQGKTFDECGDLIRKIKSVKKGKTRINFDIQKNKLDIINSPAKQNSSSSDDEIANTILLYRFFILLNKHTRLNQYLIHITGKVKDWYQLGQTPTILQMHTIHAILIELEPAINKINDEVMTKNYCYIMNRIKQQLHI